MTMVSRIVKAMIGRSRHEETEFLPAALEITETPPSPTGRWVGYIIIAFFVFALGWSIIGMVDIIATARGSVMPVGMVKVVQASDIGIVRAIRATDGFHVHRGDVLIELDRVPAAADQGRLSQDLLQARLDVARLHALTHIGGERFAMPPGTPPDAAAQALAAARAQASEQAARVAELDDQVRQKESEAAEVSATIAQLRSILPILEQKHQIRESLQSQGFGSTFALLDAEQQLTESRHQLAVLSQRAGQSRAARTALISQRAALISGFAGKVLADLATAEQRENELSQELVKAQRRLFETTLRAPTSGVIEQLAVHTIGAVVTPAQRLLIVVPDDHGLTIEAALPNRDVGFVHAGQLVKVKIEAFNFTRYGFLSGHVIDVSRNAVSRAEATASDPGSAPDIAAQDLRASSPGYIVRIALDQSSVMVDGRPRALVPGMALTAEIRIGQRSVIAYLLSPIARRVSESLQER